MKIFISLFSRDGELLKHKAPEPKAFIPLVWIKPLSLKVNKWTNEKSAFCVSPADQRLTEEYLLHNKILKKIFFQNIKKNKQKPNPKPPQTPTFQYDCPYLLPFVAKLKA